MGKYKKCPRCELNYIKEDEDLCEVCKKELAGISDDMDEEMELEEVQLCPICKVNYIGPGEEMCEQCIAERAEKGEQNDDSDIEPEQFGDQESELTPTDDDDIELVSLSEIEADEADWDEESFDDDDYEDKKHKDDLDAEFDEVEEATKHISDDELDEDEEDADDDDEIEEVKPKKSKKSKK